MPTKDFKLTGPNLYCRRCPTPVDGKEKTSFLRSKEDAMMSHFLTHLPPNQVPIVCPCKPKKYPFNSSSALRRYASHFQEDEEHLKLKLNFRPKHPSIPKSSCNNNYYFAYRCASVDYGKHYVRVSDHTKLEIRNREAKIRELNNDLSKHILNFGLRANNMKKRRPTTHGSGCDKWDRTKETRKRKRPCDGKMGLKFDCFVSNKPRLLLTVDFFLCWGWEYRTMCSIWSRLLAITDITKYVNIVKFNGCI